MNTSTTDLNQENQPKSATTALFLCLFLGFLGIHRFYVGKIWTGILMALTFGGFGIWTLIDLIYIASGHFKDKNGNELEFRKTKMSPLKLVFIILGLLILFMIAYVGTVFSVLVYLTREPALVIENQLVAIRANDLNKAYSYNSEEFKKNTSLKDFTQFIENDPVLKNNESVTFYERDLKNGKAHFIGIVKSHSGESVVVEYQLIKEGDTWKVVKMGDSVSKDKNVSQ